MPSKIRIERFMQGEGARVVLASPPGNVLDAAMMTEIGEALDGFKSEKQLKLLVFTGEGKHFSFGASVEEHVGERAAAMLKGFHGMFRKLMDLGVPTAAAVKGRCLGGGMELAAFCHRVVAHPGAVFAQPEIQLAVLAPVASLLLPWKLGQSRADDINLTGRNVEAAEAQAMGLVDAIAEDPVAAVEAWAAEQLAPKSASSLRMAARASRWELHQRFRALLPEVERLYLEDLMSTHDANEGLAAFLEKRKPSFTNS